jgi:hypothetical protein
MTLTLTYDLVVIVVTTTNRHHQGSYSERGDNKRCGSRDVHEHLLVWFRLVC